jgi:hypothetical protein
MDGVLMGAGGLALAHWGHPFPSVLVCLFVCLFLGCSSLFSLERKERLQVN